jgi:molybdopterin synthase catalytic subunit
MRASVKVTSQPIEVHEVLGSVQSSGAGCAVLFVGTVRDRSEAGKVSGMEVEAAKDLVLKDLRRISAEAGLRYGLTKVTVVHRVGKLGVGDVIVAIAVSAPHRDEAFTACRYIIDELKRTTPIWKKESLKGGSRWVEAR